MMSSDMNECHIQDAIKFYIYPLCWETRNCKTKSESKPMIAFSVINDNGIYVNHPFSIKEPSSTYHHRHTENPENPAAVLHDVQAIGAFSPS